MWTESGSDIYYDAGNVSIGTASSSTALTVDGAITLTAVTSMSGDGFERYAAKKLAMVAGGVRMVAVNDDMVGIKTAWPSYTLDVNGDARIADTLLVDAVTYSSPRTHYYSVSGDVFHPRRGLVDFVCDGGDFGGGYIKSSQPDKVLITGVNLPDGAVITAFDVQFDDTAAEDLKVYLMGHSHIGDTIYSTVTSAGVSGFGWGSETGLSYTVNNSTTGRGYKIVVLPDAGADWPDAGGTLKIMRAHITYELNEAQ